MLTVSDVLDLGFDENGTLELVDFGVVLIDDFESLVDNYESIGQY